MIVPGTLVVFYMFVSIDDQGSIRREVFDGTLGMGLILGDDTSTSEEAAWVMWSGERAIRRIMSVPLDMLKVVE